jgi:hypothetical protein
MTMEMQHTPRRTPTQPRERDVLVSIDRKLTPVYADTVPPRGLSGLLRRRAYRIHEHKARRWLLLLLADRIDVVESGVADLLKRRRALVLGLAGALGALAAARLLRRPAEAQAGAEAQG